MNETKDEIRLSPLLHAAKCKEGGYTVIFYNGVDLGKLEINDDGYYKYWPNQRPGYWDAAPLRAIADLLDHINAEWDAQVQKDCGI